MSRYKPGDRVKKLVGRLHAPGQDVVTGWLEGEVLACDIRGHITVRWDGDSKLEASHRRQGEAGMIRIDVEIGDLAPLSYVLRRGIDEMRASAAEAGDLGQEDAVDKFNEFKASLERIYAQMAEGKIE